MSYYSQHDEELYIVGYFQSKPIGKFIDIGGFHPFSFSNTRRLYELGWSGVIVEPSPKCFKSFVDEYKSEPRITLLNVAIAGNDGIITFFESNGDAVSTTNISHKGKWEQSVQIKYEEISVETVSMDSFLKEYGRDVDMISIDTESTNFELFCLIPDWFLERLKFICIEHDMYQQNIVEMLSPYGFKELHRNGENILLCK